VENFLRQQISVAFAYDLEPQILPSINTKPNVGKILFRIIFTSTYFREIPSY
jgi:hypothetical protein